MLIHDSCHSTRELANVVKCVTCATFPLQGKGSDIDVYSYIIHIQYEKTTQWIAIYASLLAGYWLTCEHQSFLSRVVDEDENGCLCVNFKKE